jgi:hypothetical protein
LQTRQGDGRGGFSCKGATETFLRTREQLVPGSE